MDMQVPLIAFERMAYIKMNTNNKECDYIKKKKLQEQSRKINSF